MKKTIFIFLAACVVLAAGCRWVGIRGNGRIKTEDRTISAFTEIDTGGAFEIEWQSGSPALRITTDENLLSYVESDVSGDALHLRTHDQIWPTHGIKVVISSPTRAAVRIRGAVKLTAKQLTGPKFDLEASGASNVSRQRRGIHSNPGVKAQGNRMSQNVALKARFIPQTGFLGRCPRLGFEKRLWR